MMGARTE